MSRETDAGVVTVVGLCRLLGVSRAGVYAARRSPAEERKAAAPPAVRTGVSGAELLVAIRAVLKDHPSWGHRKVWATLRRQGTRVGRRRVAEVMKANGEMQEANAPRADAARPRGHVVVPEPNRRFATDLTTVWTRRDGLVAVVLTVDSGCRSVLDVAATKSQESGPVLATVERALERAFGRPDQVPEGVELRSGRMGAWRCVIRYLRKSVSVRRRVAAPPPGDHGRASQPELGHTRVLADDPRIQSSRAHHN